MLAGAPGARLASAASASSSPSLRCSRLELAQARAAAASRCLLLGRRRRRQELGSPTAPRLAAAGGTSAGAVAAALLLLAADASADALAFSGLRAGDLLPRAAAAAAAAQEVLLKSPMVSPSSSPKRSASPPSTPEQRKRAGSASRNRRSASSLFSAAALLHGRDGRRPPRRALRRRVRARGVDLPAVAVSSLAEIGGRLGQAGSELGACVGGAVQQITRRVPFRTEGARGRKWEAAHPPPPAAAAADEGEVLLAVETAAHKRIALETVGDRESLEVAAAAAAAATGSAAAAGASGIGAGDADELDEDEDGFECEIGTLGNFEKAKGTVNMSATYSTRHHDFESTVVARGDLWRLESSRGSLTSGNDNAPLFLVQLGPLLFVRDSTLLLPVHLSKQHLLWYGYDRKNGVHSVCPAIWSKHRKWMLMSMMCLNPVACSFMDVQFPNGEVTYVAGEGITASGFFPLFGGLLQAHGKCPGETRVSFSFKSKQGTRFTPMFKWPDNSLSFGVAQAVAWKRSDLMVRPSVQVSVCPTFGGSDPGIRAEFVHSLKDELNVVCGFSCSRHPSAFTALSLGRSKWNGHVGSSGLVITLETPLNSMARPSLSAQLNGGFEF